MGFQSNRKQFNGEYNKKKMLALDTIGVFVSDAAKALTPVADITGGNLRLSNGYRVDQSQDQVIVGNSAEYAIYVEKGTGKYAEDGTGRKTPWAYTDEKTGELVWTEGQHPQPFIRPAFENNQAQIKQILKRTMKM